MARVLAEFQGYDLHLAIIGICVFARMCVYTYVCVRACVLA